MKPIRQGDVLLIPQTLPYLTLAQTLPHLTLAEGKVSGERKA